MAAILALLCFGCLLMLGYGFSMWLQQRLAAQRELMNRLRSMAGISAGSEESRSLLKDQRLSGIPAFDVLLSRAPIIAPLVRTIQQAGLRRRVGEVLLYIPLLGCIAYLFCSLIGLRPIVRLVVAIIMALMPILVVSRMRTKRLQMFGEQLPDSLDLVRSALQAGHGLIAAFQVVAETFPDPVATEFRYIVDEVRLGLPFRDALYNLAVRVGDPNVPILVVGVLTAQDVGGNMAEVIDNVTHTIRERAKLRRDIQVLTAQGRLSGLVLTALPFGVGGFMYLYNPTYFRPMIERPTGHLLMMYGICSLLAGHFMVRRIVKIEV
jgi:tight adherence protein B